MRALGRVRDSQALGPWLALAKRIDENALANRAVRQTAAASLTSLLRSSPAACTSLRDTIDHIPERVVEVIAISLAQRDDAQALEVLMRVLGRSRSSDGEVLRAIAAAARNSRTPTAEADLERVRTYLAATDDRMRADACIALGGLSDAHVAPQLIERMSDEELIVRASARTALERLAKTRPGEGIAAWRAWLEREDKWYTNRWPLLRGALSDANEAHVELALSELASHPLYRHELAAEMSPLCDDARVAVAVAACAAAEKLESLAAAKGLVDALDSPKPEISQASWSALQKISGRLLPPKPSSWRDALGL
jgi:HEAT repeat protein